MEHLVTQGGKLTNGGGGSRLRRGADNEILEEALSADARNDGNYILIRRGDDDSVLWSGYLGGSGRWRSPTSDTRICARERSRRLRSRS